ncbi:hypothetical protein DFH08DRAFT_970772 [Mycena albidolilacea]|uniref:Uncharacterized protein n=1 Tax=Mycena albidolilacea TaxID=1033008 RepID=A0AAD7EGL2_9AGAR|nr:hypothetical protein DFH08DRAFT_970772 [Mycena albidolilacea]
MSPTLSSCMPSLNHLEDSANASAPCKLLPALPSAAAATTTPALHTAPAPPRGAAAAATEHPEISRPRPATRVCAVPRRRHVWHASAASGCVRSATTAAAAAATASALPPRDTICPCRRRWRWDRCVWERYTYPLTAPLPAAPQNHTEKIKMRMGGGTADATVDADTKTKEELESSAFPSFISLSVSVFAWSFFWGKREACVGTSTPAALVGSRLCGWVSGLERVACGERVAEAEAARDAAVRMRERGARVWARGGPRARAADHNARAKSAQQQERE